MKSLLQKTNNLYTSVTWIVIGLFLIHTFHLSAQTQSGKYYISLHNFSPSGLHIDELPVSLFPQNNGIGFSFGRHKVRLDGQRLDVTERVTTFGLGLSGHSFVFHNFSFGIVGNYYSGSTVYEETGKADEKFKTSLLLGGIELRYFVPLNDRLHFWMKASPALGFIQSSYNQKEVHTPKRLYQFTGGVGISYFASANFTLDLGASYNVFTVRNKGSYTENSRKEYVDNVGIHLGFSIFL